MESFKSSDNGDKHDLLYKLGRNLVWPYLKFSDRPGHNISPHDIVNINAGIKYLELALDVRPGDSKNWATYWTLGKAYAALGDLTRSYTCHRQAFSLNHRHIDAARELMASCLAIGKKTEALAAAKAARDLEPYNAGIAANLALALLTNEMVDEAMSVAQEALAISPADSITQSLVAECKNRLQVIRKENS